MVTAARTSLSHLTKETRLSPARSLPSWRPRWCWRCPAFLQAALFLSPCTGPRGHWRALACGVREAPEPSRESQHKLLAGAAAARAALPCVAVPPRPASTLRLMCRPGAPVPDGGVCRVGLGRVRAWAGEGGPVQGEIGPPGRGGGGAVSSFWARS